MIELLHGDCLERLRELPDCSVDAIVTDPPYGLSFMGRKWDYDVPSTEIWRQCLRVLKPGGHLLAFAGTRTQHRMCVNIEDAGFEIRDMIAWLYGSGFPKSMDISKAIDKLDAKEDQERRRLRFTAWVRSTGVTSRQIDKATKTNMGGHYTTAASQPAIMTREHLEQCRHLLGDVPEWVEREADIRSVESQNFKAREVVGPTRRGAQVESTGRYGAWGDGITPTASHTPEAQQWEGWGTALKPALEPITVARKPFKGTVAQNVLEHGTGGINIDACRVGTDQIKVNVWKCGGEQVYNGRQSEGFDGGTHQGRWPANLIHDGSDEVVELFPDTTSGKPGVRGKAHETNAMSGRLGLTGETEVRYADSGSAARFFYCAKASKVDREDGNVHPTVKPTDLMAYLCRLVTPPGGIVLDPFMGSGSTGKAAIREGFGFIGIEREAEYFEIAQQRVLLPEQKQGELL